MTEKNSVLLPNVWFNEFTQSMYARYSKIRWPVVCHIYFIHFKYFFYWRHEGLRNLFLSRGICELLWQICWFLKGCPCHFPCPCPCLGRILSQNVIIIYNQCKQFFNITTSVRKWAVRTSRVYYCIQQADNACMKRCNYIIT